MKCSSLAALEVVKMTTSSAASDENFVKMTTFLFQWFCAKLLEWYLCKSHMLFATISTHLHLDKMAAILADNIFKCIFLNEKLCILIQISLKYIPGHPINNSQALI